MAQRIQQSMIPGPDMSVARRSLPDSSVKRGLGGMNPPDGGANAFDGGMRTKVAALDIQSEAGMQLGMQNRQQNAIAQAPQLAANNMRNVDKAITQESSAQQRVAQDLSRYKANLIDNGPTKGRYMKSLNREMEGPNRDKFLNDIAVSAAAGRQQAPQLGQYIAEANRYAWY